ncbi:hypothetical protein LP420_15385 [Massilia sp. B-10]|nr:hypothetical protein LP420_15385 [Massilia sp. B-10]
MTDHIASLKSKHRFSLNWGYLNAITSGMSAIDLSRAGAAQSARRAPVRARIRLRSRPVKQPRRASCAATARRSISSPPIFWNRARRP